MAARLVLTLLALPIFAACGSTPELLVAKNPQAPPGVDFSGYWNLRHDPANDAGNSALGRAAAGEGIYIPPENTRRASGRSRSSRQRSSPGQVRVFLEQGDQLKITQTRDGIFISFDRSVVEEFRFGEQRVISIGEISAQRVSGWEDQEYVVETLDRESMKLTERFSLSQDGQVLRRQIVFRDSELREASMQEVFDRDPG